MQLSIQLDSAYSGFWSLLHDWQTLIAGLLALTAAGVVIWQTRRMIAEDRRKQEQQRKQQCIEEGLALYTRIEKQSQAFKYQQEHVSNHAANILQSTDKVTDYINAILVVRDNMSIIAKLPHFEFTVSVAAAWPSLVTDARTILSQHAKLSEANAAFRTMQNDLINTVPFEKTLIERAKKQQKVIGQYNDVLETTADKYQALQADLRAKIDDYCDDLKMPSPFGAIGEASSNDDSAASFGRLYAAAPPPKHQRPAQPAKPAPERPRRR